jgi:hypothetical protein
MRKKEGLKSMNIRFTPEMYELLQKFQLSESNRLSRCVSLNSCILRSIKLAAKSSTATNKPAGQNIEGTTP